MTNILTHSSMSTYRDCRRKYYFRYILGLVPSQEKASLRLGSAFHKGVELYYQGKDLQACIYGAGQLFQDADTTGWTESDYEEMDKQAAILEGMLRGYALRLNDREEFQEVIPEREFLNPIINPATGASTPRFQHAGKADGLFKRDGQWWLREFKTASSIDKGYVDRLKLDTQITSYMEALQADMGITIAGIIYTVVKKPSIKQTQKETPAQYCERVIADYQDRLDFYFWQEQFYRNQNDLVEWQYERWDIQKDIAESMRTERWYRNTSSCGQYGGCAYMPLCCQGEQMIHLYKQEPPHRELEIVKTKGENTDGHASTETGTENREEVPF